MMADTPDPNTIVWFNNQFVPLAQANAVMLGVLNNAAADRALQRLVKGLELDGKALEAGRSAIKQQQEVTA